MTKVTSTSVESQKTVSDNKEGVGSSMASNLTNCAEELVSHQTIGPYLGSRR